MTASFNQTMLIEAGRVLNRTIRKGSLICIMLIIFSSQAALAASLPIDMTEMLEPQGMDLETAKNGIVRVQAGVEDEDGTIEKRSKASGFIVSSDGSNVYIVTTLHAVDFGEKGRVQVSVKNDSAVDAEIVLRNKENDFCILSAENSFNDKSEVPIRVDKYEDEDNKLSDGDEVIALGFPEESGNSSDFDAGDVAIQKGKIIKAGSENGGIIDHDATVHSGLDGGVLVDKDGYVIGLINPSIGASCAKDISEVDAVLVSKGLAYRSKDKDEMYAELYNLCAEVEDLYKRADKESKQELYRTRENAMEVLISSPCDRELLTSSLTDFHGVIEGANLKIPKLLILIYALASVIVILTIKLITLIIWNKKNSPKILKDAEKSRLRPMPVNDTRYQSISSSSAAQLRDLNTGRVFNIDKSSILIGKSADSDYTIPQNNKVSRKHAVVECRGGSYRIRDLSSTNGTYLNNIRIGTEGEALYSGDIISMAGEQIEFIQR